MKSKLFWVITIVEIMIIALVVVVIIHKRQGAVSAVSVAALNKDNLEFTKTESFKYFYEPRPGINDINGEPSWLTYKPTYEINSDGLRDTVNHAVKKDSDTFRIITLGDSFTYGLYVNNNESWPKVLENLLNTSLQCEKIKNFEVLNLGMGGYDISYSAERFKLRGLKYDPDLVIWMLKMDDFEDINDYVLPDINNYLEAHKGITDSDRFKKWREIHDNFRKTYGVQNILSYQENTMKSINDNYHNSTLIYGLKNMLERNDMDILGTINNYLNSVEKSFFYNDDVDLHKLGGLYPDGHPNKKGNKKIADNMYSYITSNKIIPCN